MAPGTRTISLVALAVACALVLAARPAHAAPPQGSSASISRAVAPARSPAVTFGGYVLPYYYPSFGGYGWFGGLYPPFIGMPSIPSTYPYLPKYWWVSPYPIGDPRQEGYNPNSGYPKETVTTLLLVTYPAKTRIILDGIYVGNSDYLGPIQLPLGEHTLRAEAPGYEPSETVLKIEEPVLQQLEIRLKRVTVAEKPGPQR